MRKLLALILTSASFLLIAPDVVTKVSAANTVTNPQLRVQIGRNRRWRNRHYRDYGRTTIQTRYVRRGWNTYRETYQIRFLPNGMVRTDLISRVRVS